MTFSGGWWSNIASRTEDLALHQQADSTQERLVSIAMVHYEAYRCTEYCDFTSGDIGLLSREERTRRHVPNPEIIRCHSPTSQALPNLRELERTPWDG